MLTFDPIAFDFIELRNFRLGGAVPVYEYRNHPAVDGDKNFLRLNVYLSKDGEFVTIWHGLLDFVFAEAQMAEDQLAFAERPDDFESLLSSYNEHLFRGYIDSDVTAQYVFKALRIDGVRYASPSELSVGSDNKLRCDRLGRA
jgi:hypothetical protein